MLIFPPSAALGSVTGGIGLSMLLESSFDSTSFYWLGLNILFVDNFDWSRDLC